MKYQLDIDLFQGYQCPGIPVSEELYIEVEFSDAEVVKIRQLVKDYTGDKDAGLMPILENDAPDLHKRIADAAYEEIRNFYIVEGLKEDGFDLDEDAQQRYFKEDLESGDFDPEEFIDESMCYDEVPDDEEDLFCLWQEWERSEFACSDASWAISRYPDIVNQIDVSNDQDYICSIPDDFLSL